MKATQLLLLALLGLGAAACGRHEALTEIPKPSPDTGTTHPVTPQPTPPAPAPRPYTGYEGYSLLFDSGLAQVLTAQPEGVSGAPHLYLIDREGKQAGEVLGDLLGDYDGKGDICEGMLTEAGGYLAYLAKYDFRNQRKHQSRLILLEKQTLKLVSNRLFAQPGRGGDEWVRQSFTLADGSTYLTFDKRSYYLLPKEGTEMTKLSMPVAYAKAAYAWGKRGYFFLEDDEAVYLFEAGQTSPTKLPLFAGSSVRAVYPAGGEWLVLRDQENRYQLFSMRTGQVAQRFTLSQPAGRTMVYDGLSHRLFFAGDKGGQSGSEASERSIYVVQLPQDKLPAGQSTEALTAMIFLRLAGRTEADNRIGMQPQLGLQPDRRQFLVSWLDQGRGGPQLQPVTKVLSFPLDTAPTTSLAQYTFAGASDIRSIITLSRVE